MEDYENFQPVFSKALTFEEREDGFHFNISENIAISEGLFYYQIEDDMGEVLYLNKFSVE